MKSIHSKEFRDTYPLGSYVYENPKYINVYATKDNKHVVKEYLNGNPSVEFSILNRFNHTNIIKPVATSFLNGNIVLALIKGKNTILNTKGSMKLTRDHLFDLVQTLKFIHKNQVLHNDIKVQNIVIIDNVPTFIDFGLSEYMILTDQGHIGINNFGSQMYNSPESLASEASDIYALGFTFYYFMASSIERDRSIIDLTLITKCPLFSDLITGMTNIDMNDRLKIDQILEHKYFQGCIDRTSGSINHATTPLPITIGNTETYDYMVDIILKLAQGFKILNSVWVLIFHNLHRVYHLIPELTTENAKQWAKAIFYITVDYYIKDDTIDTIMIDLIKILGGIVFCPTNHIFYHYGDIETIIASIDYDYPAIQYYNKDKPEVDDTEIKTVITPISLELKTSSATILAFDKRGKQEIIPSKSIIYIQPSKFLTVKSRQVCAFEKAYRYHKLNRIDLVVYTALFSTTRDTIFFEPFLDYNSGVFLSDLKDDYGIPTLELYFKVYPITRSPGSMSLYSWLTEYFRHIEDFYQNYV